MSDAFGAINIADLPAPPFVAPLDYETILAETKATFIALHPQAADVIDLESEPAVKLMQVIAYRELSVRQNVNDQARAVSLPYAQGAELDTVGARYNVARKQLGPGDPTTVPPTPPLMEGDAAFRARVQLAFEGLADAGPEGAYLSVVSGLDGVRGAAAIGPSHPRNRGAVANGVRPGEVLIVVLGYGSDGTAQDTLLEAVRSAVMASNIRTITHKILVRTAAIRHYTIRATLTFRPGPDRTVVLDQARRQVAAYVAAAHAVGQSVRLSAIYGALHLDGVDRVALDSPVDDILIASHEAPYCTEIELIDGGVDG